jgi:hypothetical protein
MSLVKTALKQEIAERTQKSQDYFVKMKTAKTKIKEKTYAKKLKENNNILADLIIALDKLNESQYNTQDNNKNGKGDVESNNTEQD